MPVVTQPYADYLRALDAALRRHAGTWRVGQTFFNVLAELRPELANVVRGGDLDPFHRDDRIAPFLVWVRAHWDETR